MVNALNNITPGSPSRPEKLASVGAGDQHLEFGISVFLLVNRDSTFQVYSFGTLMRLCWLPLSVS
jgi:hypothetical protein